MKNVRNLLFSLFFFLPESDGVFFLGFFSLCEHDQA